MKNGLCALAINEDCLYLPTVKEAAARGRDLFAQFLGSDGISLGVMSPQMLRSPCEVHGSTSISEFRAAVRWMLIDEAHVVGEESGTFKEPYGAILPVRAPLPSGTVWAVVTGTATPARALAIIAALGFQHGRYVSAGYTIDRPNIKYIPRFFEHPTSGFEFLDLSFVVPFGVKSPQEIPSTLIFAKTIQMWYRIMQFLDSLIPSTVPHRLGIIKLYNVLMPLDYRREFITDSRQDIPTLSRVIIAHVGDLGDSPEIRKQQMGHPSWVKNAPASEIRTKQDHADLLRREQLPVITYKFFNPTPLCCPRGADLKYNGEPFILHPGSGVRYAPEPEQSRDLGMVARWVNHFKEIEQGKKAKLTTIRADGTYQELDATLKKSPTNILLQ
ncbi:hypothetical protein B0H10DRAFT_1974819 [Mycena sp. CBHHK59/15]|nr:hypothetical protein B0H10DRAFT_1974819 [Mycena sp. CBHHK59/15]